MGQYNNQCPVCGGYIRLTSFVGSTSISVEEDGWSYGEESIDSSEEVFHCADCGKRVPEGYVFKTLSKAKAAAQMSKFREVDK